MIPGKKSLKRGLAAVTVALVLLPAAPAHAYPFTRELKEGDTGDDVKALQVRVAGWFSPGAKRHLPLDGVFSAKTTEAVQAFQEFYGILVADGVARQDTFDMLNSLEDPDGSTTHFNWGEFHQNRSSSCSAQANAYSGSFRGGMVAPSIVKRNIRRLMWRLEALRAKGGGKPIGVNSAFRSVPYNDCIGGARASQHMYGTAVDNRMQETSNRLERDLAKASQFHGIGCYASLSHNHFDIRIDNAELGSSRAWWWPERDERGRDLDEDGQPCYGETREPRHQAVPSGSGPIAWNAFIPTRADISSFEAAGEPASMAGAD